MNASFSNDMNPSISATGEALIALDKELEELADQDERLMIKRLHIHQKMKQCTDAIKRLLVVANNGVYPQPCPSGRFPELHSID